MMFPFHIFFLPWEVLSSLYQFYVVFTSSLLPDGLCQRPAKVFWAFHACERDLNRSSCGIGIMRDKSAVSLMCTVAPVLEIIKPFRSRPLKITNNYI